MSEDTREEENEVFEGASIILNEVEGLDDNALIDAVLHDYGHDQLPPEVREVMQEYLYNSRILSEL